MKKLSELSLKNHVIIHFTALFGGIVIGLIGCLFSSENTLHPIVWVGLAAMAVGFVWRLVFVKCPLCGSPLFQTKRIPTYCPDCGKRML